MNLKLSKAKIFLVIAIIIIAGLLTAGEATSKIKKNYSIKKSDNNINTTDENIEFKEVDQSQLNDLIKKRSEVVSLQVEKLISEEKDSEENKLKINFIENNSIKDKLQENLKTEYQEKKIEKKDNLNLKVEALIAAPEENRDMKNSKIKLMINKE